MSETPCPMAPHASQNEQCMVKRSEPPLRTGQIRILQLLQGDYDSPLKCELFKAPLSTAYEALSYAWGHEISPRPLLIDDETTQITTNLEAALRRLRQPRVDRYLWVDALCINQQSDEEKSRQVSMMGHIYTRSNGVILWLGDYAVPHMVNNMVPLNPEQIQKAFEFVERMASGTCYGESGIDHKENHSASQNALEKLMKVRWWSRMWTVQELILASQGVFMFGDKHISMDTMLKACSFSRMHHFGHCCRWDLQLPTFWDELVSASNMRAARADNHPPNRSFCDALNMYRARQVTHDKDRVYALMGLEPNLWADYTVSAYVAFITTVVTSIKVSGSLHPLIRTSEKSRPLSLPSWVPDWCSAPDLKANNQSSQMSWLSLQGYYNASAGRKAKIRDSGSREILSLQGYLVDRVKETGPRHTKLGSEIEDCKKIVGRSSSQKNDVYPRGGKPYDEAFWRVSMADVLPEWNGDRCEYRRATSEDKAYCEEGLDEARSDPPPEPARIVGRNFFSTDEGLLGLCHEGVETGDCVFVLLGFTMPFILRPIKPSPADIGAYAYVAQAYVHGIMNGEIIRELHKPQWISLH